MARTETSTVPYALVVDGDPLILMDAHDILEEAGFRIHKASDGDAAKELLDDLHDEVILLFLDVEMPGDTDAPSFRMPQSKPVRENSRTG